MVIKKTSFVLMDEDYLPLKISSIENGVKLPHLFGKIISDSPEIKDHYTPIKNLKPIPNFSKKRREEGFRQVFCFIDDKIKQKLQIMSVINNVSLSEIIRCVVVKNSPKLPSENGNMLPE